MNCWPPTFLKFVNIFRELEMINFTQTPPSFLHDVIIFAIVFMALVP